MAIKAVIADNPIFDCLVSNATAAGGADFNTDILRIDESQCHSALIDNKADIAFLSPLGYGLGATQADFRIIPGRCMAASGYTGLASIVFRGGLHTIRKCGMAFENEFSSVIAKLLLAEKFGIQPQFDCFDAPLQEILLTHEAAVIRGVAPNDYYSLDVSEEWFDSYEVPLPLGFWVCRHDCNIDSIAAITESLADSDLPAEEVITENNPVGDNYPRSGKIHYRWNDEIEATLVQTIHLLYYRLLLSDIAAIKILGRD
jgi:predicted solute-binding protein